MADTKSSLIDIFNAVFPSTASLEASQYDTLSKDDVEEWDSLNQLNLLVAIEEEFGIKVSDEDAVQFTSFSHILDHLSKTPN